MIRKFRGVILLLLTLVTVGCGSRDPQFRIKWAWARPADIGGNSAVYFSITNTRSDDSLLSASTEIAEKVQIHMTTANADGTVSMVQQTRVELHTGTRVDFQPGGLHIMLMDLKTPLADGDTFPLKLKFDNAKDLTIDVPVQAP